MLRTLALIITLSVGVVSAQDTVDPAALKEHQSHAQALFREAEVLRQSNRFQVDLSQQREAVHQDAHQKETLKRTRGMKAGDVDQPSKIMDQVQEVVQSDSFQQDLAQDRQSLTVRPLSGQQLYDLSKMPSPQLTAKSSLLTPDNSGISETPFTDGPLVFVSFSMPESLIVDYLQEAQRMNAQVVLRGAEDGDLLATIQKIQKLIARHKTQGFFIDPTLFRRFKVTHVPTLVLPLEPLKPCQSEQCEAPKYAKASGNISIHAFLKTVARLGHDDEQRKAKALIKRFEDES